MVLTYNKAVSEVTRVSEIAPTKDDLWVYRAYCVRVVDGDTLDVYLDSGFHSYRVERLRLLGVNCPEVRGPTKAAGDAATRYVGDWLVVAETPADEWSLVIQTQKTDVFGRYLTTLWRVVDGACLNEDLLASGHAVPHKGIAQ
jgi:micrococcal nuclease